jgi:predicted RND superfamily exporter protein
MSSQKSLTRSPNNRISAAVSRITDRIASAIIGFIQRVMIGHPWLTIICLVSLIAGLGYFSKDFKIDASAETLMQENDESLRYARDIYARYGVQDFLIIACSPKADLLSDESLGMIARLRDEIKAMERVESVLTLLDVPLLESPPLPIKELAGDLRTLSSPNIDRALAAKELKTSPLYRNLLVSPDLKTTGIQVNFKPDTVFQDMIRQRDTLRDKSEAQGLTNAESAAYDEVVRELSAHGDDWNRDRHADIAQVRAIMDKYRGEAGLFLGGISMIADDLISFVKNDLKVFGTGVFVFLILTMGIIFRKPRWVILPMICCLFSAIAMLGILGLSGWKVTVISSNFISLQLIMTMAYTIHLVVRYRELLTLRPEATQRELVGETVRMMLVPIFYSATTTIAGFASLVSCDIVPVINFGWMMMAGITVSLVVTFVFFPAGLTLFPKTPPPSSANASHGLILFMGRLTEFRGKWILAVCAAAFIFSVIGISRLVVENSFINYFKDSTEIYQGMTVIDQELGGTTPLDIIVRFDELDVPEENAIPDAGPPVSDEFDDFAEFEETGADNAANQSKYWFTPYKMNKVLEVHDYLDSLPETGKVLSLGTMMKIGTTLNSGKPLDSFELSLVYNEIPDNYKALLVKPYASVEHNEARLSLRVRDSDEHLRRNEFINKVRHDLTDKLGFPPKSVELTGMMVLYNNMLQSLFSSQIETMGIVLLALMVMFLILFRSIHLAVIAIFPNLLSIAVVLGFMGWMKMPLDMMTITIASISVGIAVDDTIHYIHRFTEEIKVDGDYVKAMHRCHESIGYAMFYTSVAVIIGFSILVLSNFIPSILFGLLTGLAMLIAIIAALTLLPTLIILIKPFGPGIQKA